MRACCDDAGPICDACKAVLFDGRIVIEKLPQREQVEDEQEPAKEAA